jgi:hypothetical protein
MTTSALTGPAADAKWINRSIVVGSAIFVFALAVAAIFAPQWRVLHVLQALIYVAVVVLARRNSAWGFGAGVFIGAFWNVLVLFRSPIGLQAVAGVGALIHGGPAPRPDVMLQAFAACGNFLIIAACLVGFFRTRPGARQWGQFAAGGVLAIGYLLAMVFTVGPPEGAQHIRQALGL